MALTTEQFEQLEKFRQDLSGKSALTIWLGWEFAMVIESILYPMDEKGDYVHGSPPKDDY